MTLGRDSTVSRAGMIIMTLAGDLNLANKKCFCGVGKLKNKRSVIPIILVHWEIWDLEIFQVAPDL